MSWFLACRDMEAACDEAVLRRSPEDIRKNYSTALLSLAVAHPLRVPLAFGENDVKGRVKGALRWKRPAAALVAVALVALLASCYMLAANPAQVPETAPELTVTVEGSTTTLAPETGVLDWTAPPFSPVRWPPLWSSPLPTVLPTAWRWRTCFSPLRIPLPSPWMSR